MADKGPVAPALIFGEKVERVRENLEAGAYYALWSLYELDPRNEPRELRRARLSLDRSLSRPGDRQLGQPEGEDRPPLKLLLGPGGS